MHGSSTACEVQQYTKAPNHPSSFANMAATLPTLRTTRLEMRPLGPEDKEFLFQLDSDPVVMKYIYTGKPLDRETSEMIHKHLVEIPASGPGFGCWVGVAGDDLVGWWVLAPSQTTDDPPQVNKERAEYGMRITPKFWGQGYAKEGSRAVLRHAFEDLAVKEVYGETMAVNAGSRATMAGCGLKHVRTFHNKYDDPPPGIEEGEVEYRITRDEWSALQ